MIDDLGRGFFDVTRFGAKGDGIGDDTAAVREALASAPRGGVVFFPPGTYLLDTIEVPEERTLMGRAAWTYRTGGGTVIHPLREGQECLFSVYNTIGVKFVGLSLDGRKMGSDMHGIKVVRPGEIGSESMTTGCAEMDTTVDGCRIGGFSGAGLFMRRAFVWHIRHSMFVGNGGAGIDATDCYDAWVSDCQMAENGGPGIKAEMMAAVTISGCRIECCKPAGILIGPDYADSVQIANCMFDVNRGPAIDIGGRKIWGITITGNVFRRSGFQSERGVDENCHLRLRNALGISVTGNSLIAWQVGGKNHPDIGMVLENLHDSVIAENAMYHCALKEVIRDHGGHEGLVLRDNPGSLQAEGDMEA